MRPLAEQGNAEAQNGMGALYYHGYGVTQDFKEAIKWYRLAAAQGNLEAQLNLGSMYYEGEGVAEDLARSHMWLSIVADHGYGDAAKMRDTVGNDRGAGFAIASDATQMPSLKLKGLRLSSSVEGLHDEQQRLSI
jgi:TPR repeat protein